MKKRIMKIFAFAAPEKTNPISNPAPTNRPGDYDYAKQTQYCSTPEIRPRRIHAAPPARRSKINQTCFRFFETPQKLQKIASLSHIFAGFYAFLPPIGGFVRAILPKNPHSRPKKSTQMRISTPFSPIADSTSPLYSSPTSPHLLPNLHI